MPGWLSVQLSHPERIAVPELSGPRSISNVQFLGALALFSMVLSNK